MLGKDLSIMQILRLFMWDSVPEKHQVNAKSCTQLTRAHTHTSTNHQLPVCPMG